MLREIQLIKETTVSRTEFNPVKTVVYGLVGLIMTGVVLALLSAVIAK